jgi:hypothetical protein
VAGYRSLGARSPRLPRPRVFGRARRGRLAACGGTHHGTRPATRLDRCCFAAQTRVWAQSRRPRESSEVLHRPGQTGRVGGDILETAPGRSWPGFCGACG